MNDANAEGNRLGLLVSVKSAEEAAMALSAGVDLIDVKDPARGSLGMAHHETVAAVLAAVDDAIPVSAALGEWDANSLTEACWHLELPLSFVKWGLAGYGTPPGWGEDLLETRRQVPASTEVVLVSYVDHEKANMPPPAELVKFARRYRYRAMLFDTFNKDSKTLLDHLPIDTLTEMVQSLTRAGVQVALGGSLQPEHVKVLRPVGANWLAVRGAVCVGGKRDADLDPVRLKKWRSILDT